MTKPDYKKIIHSTKKRRDEHKTKLLQISSQLMDVLEITDEEVFLLRDNFSGIVFPKLHLSISAEPLPWSNWKNLLTIRPTDDDQHRHTLQHKYISDDEELGKLVERLYRDIE